MYRIDEPTASQIINSVYEVCGCGINFINRYGIIFASTDRNRIGDFHEIGFECVKSGRIIEVHSDTEFGGTKKGVNIPIFWKKELIAVIGISGEPDEVRKYTQLAVKITLLIIREQELEAKNRTHKEKCSYIIRSLIRGHMENRDYFYECIQEFGIEDNVPMKMVVVKLNARYNLTNISLINQEIELLFDSDEVLVYSYIYPNEYTALVRADKNSFLFGRLKSFAESRSPVLKIGIGSEQELGRMVRSYENAKTSLKTIEKSEVCFSDFSELDLEILLAEISHSGTSSYIEKTLSTLTDEDIEILSVYFENNMSLSATCRSLFLHKNTLQYKLDRISRRCGYNPRSFKSAVILYLALKLQIHG